MFSESTEGLGHCHKSLFLSPLQLLAVSDGPPHVCRSALDLHSHSQTSHAIFHDLLDNADASQHSLTDIRQDKTCILAMLHFINTSWVKVLLGANGKMWEFLPHTLLGVLGLRVGQHLLC